MANISDIIEDFIIGMIGSENALILSRNELANYFSCAPSQINYVLSTRFTPQKGYVIESRRGSGGGITLIRISEDRETLFSGMLDEVSRCEYFTYNKACEYLTRLKSDGIIGEEEEAIIRAAISPKALVSTAKTESELRKQIFSEILTQVAKRR